jgi:quinone-modifying oxidoreductase, subunit QmoC
MTDKYLAEPDLGFIREVTGLGGDSLKKCFQCATCSVACPISPEQKPFPRKEMIAASWGLKDRLLADHDIWLCHNCGDCSTLCPRGAKPGDVLAALRAYAISEYSEPKIIGKWLNNPKMLPVVFALPVVIFLFLGMALKLVGINWLDFTPGGDEIVHAKFFSSWLVDMIFLPTAGWAVAVFAWGIWRFLNDCHESALREGKTDKETIEPVEFVKAFVRIIPSILKHDKFTDCSENRERSTAHLMVFFSFIALFIVTNIFFIHLYVLQIHGPYPQIHPVKWLANVAGICLVIGGFLMLKERLTKTDQLSTYKDWYLVGLVLGLGLTGMLTEMTRLAGAAGMSYGLYFLHLVFVWNLFAFVPFSKLAHLVYRTVALTYDEYAGRK